MLKQLALLFALSFFLFSGIAVHAQSGTDSSAIETAMYAKRLADYRQKFWDSLPAPVSWTNDYIWLFTPEQRDYLDSLVTDFEKKTSVEIAIVTIDTFCTAIENFNELIAHFGNTWGIGKKEKNNGILIGISPLYRRIRISNGSGIQQKLTDEETTAILNNYFIPEFANGNYFAGTAAGLQAIIDKLSPRFKTN